MGVSLAEFVDHAAGEAAWFTPKYAAISFGPDKFFVHVRVPEDVARKLVAVQRRVLPEGAIPQEIDHVTLVHVPSPKTSDDVPSPDLRHRALEALREVGERTEPIKAKIQGWAYFDGASKDGEPKTALVALLDAPGLETLHVDMRRALEQAGLDPSRSHTFTPHVTFGYLEHRTRAEAHLEPLSGEFTIDKVHVAADQPHEILLEARPASAEPLSMGKAAAAMAPLPAALLEGLGGAALWGGVPAGIAALKAKPGHRGHAALMAGVPGAVAGGLIHGTIGAANAADRVRWEGEAAARRAEEAAHATRGRGTGNPFGVDDDLYERIFGARGAAGSRGSATPREQPPRYPPPGAAGDAWSAWRQQENDWWKSRGFGDRPGGSGSGNASRGSAWAEPAGVLRDQLHDVAPFLRGVGTKADARSAYRAAARSAHPDLGGSSSAMQQINDQWERAQGHPDFQKLAAGVDLPDELDRFRLR